MNIRARMILLSVLSILPSIFFIFYLNSNEKSIHEKQQIENLTKLTKLYSEEHYQVIENARHLLLALSIAPQLQTNNIDGCNKFLASLLSTYARYSNFGVTNNNGYVICSAVKTDKSTNISDTLFYKDTKNTNSFAIGEYRVSTITNNAVLSFGYPTANGIIYSSVDLEWLNKLTTALSTDEDISTTVLDKSGNILSQNLGHDNPPDELFPKEELLKKMKELDEGIIENINLSNIKKTYAFKRIGDQANSPYVVLGVSNEKILKETNNIFFNKIALSIVVTLVCLGFAWWAGGILIVKQVEELKKLDNLKDDFISLVSHQIRTPLTSISWFTEILLNQSKNNIPKKEGIIIKDIHEISKNIINLVGTFLNISKIESGKIILNLEETNLDDLITEVINDLKVNLNQKKIKLIVKNDVGIAKIDNKLMKQVYTNLISNAVKYSGPKGIININVHKNNSELITKIKDNGIGIPQHDKGKIFQKFFRAKNASDYNPDGSGLGLYLVKIIIEAHKGNIYFRSQKNRGTTFIFNLPITK
jgi:signal transduction histidine kinase